MRSMEVHPLLLHALIILSCDVKAEVGSFKLINSNRKPSSEFHRLASVSALQCAVTCNIMKDCASFAVEDQTTKLCVLSKDAESGEESAGFMHYVKTELLTRKVTTTPSSTTGQQDTTQAPTPSTTSDKGTTSEVTTTTASNVKRNEINPEAKDFNAATMACQDAGMQLVKIKDQTASDNLENLIKSSSQKCSDTWIGLKIKDSGKPRFEWHDHGHVKLNGKKWKPWANWEENEPDDYLSGDKNGCVSIVTSASAPTLKWRDNPCDKAFCFICE